MPTIKPVLNKINAFDAKNGATLYFSWTGGQAQANRIVIYEYGKPENVVYDCTLNTMALRHALHLPGIETDDDYTQAEGKDYKLVNGTRYSAVVYVFYRVGNELVSSLASSEVSFYCLEEPEFKFTNFGDEDPLPDIVFIGYNSVYLNVHYSQGNGETISEYAFSLYDSSGTLLLKSNTFYGSAAEDNLQYTIGGVTDNNSYKVVCEAVTTHGMSLYVEQKFIVQKDTQGVGALVTVEKLPNNSISISSHFKIVGSNINGKETYVNDINNKPFAIDLTDRQTVTFFDGFTMNSPWSITAIVKACKENTVLFTCQNESGESLKVSYIVKRYSLSQKSFYMLEVTRKTTPIIIRTDYAEISDDWKVLYLAYENGYYTLKCYNPEDLGYLIQEKEEA